jgi:hypothetical protein
MAIIVVGTAVGMLVGYVALGVLFSAFLVVWWKLAP